MKARFRTAPWAALVLLVTSARAQDAPSVPLYEPQVAVSRTIRIWGNDKMAGITRLWQQGFRERHPGVRFEIRLMGTGTAMAGLYSGVADLAFMGRESTPKELMAFEWVYRYKPMRVELMTGSLDVPGHSPALVVFVHKDNPLSRISLAQLDAVFGHEHRRGTANIRTWDQLGLGAEWAGRPVNAYGYDVETGTGEFFRQAVLAGSYKLNWERLEEFRDAAPADGDGSRRILDALGKDRFGIAVSNLRYANPQVKPLPLGANAAGPWVAATTDTLVSRQYPLSRVVSAWVNRPPGRPLDPSVKEFLRYVLSRDGQEAILRNGVFLPLDAGSLRGQRAKLE